MKDDEHDSDVFEKQVGANYGDAKMNFRMFPPSFWLFRMTGIMPRQFEDTRNILLRKRDLFDNDPYRSIIVHVLEFQIIGMMIALSRLQLWITDLLYGAQQAKAMNEEDSTMRIIAICLLVYYILAWFLSHARFYALELSARDSRTQVYDTLVMAH